MFIMKDPRAAKISAFLLAFCLIGSRGAETWSTYTMANSPLPTNYIRSCAIDDSGNLWVGTHGGALATFRGTSWTIYTPPFPDPSFSSLTSVAAARNGMKWAGTDGGGLLRFDGSRWDAFTTATSGIPGDFINAVVIDSSGAVWIGAEDGGVARYAAAQWTVFDTANSALPDNSVSALAAGNGCMWIGVRNVYAKKGGLCKLTGSTMIVYDTANSGLPGEYVYAVAIDKNGIVWAGTNKGLASFNGSEWRTFSAMDSGMPYNTIFTLSIDSSGNKWMGAGNSYPGGGGLLKFSGTQWTLFAMSNSGIPDNYVWSVACDGDAIWIGTEFGGVAGLVDGSPALRPRHAPAPTADLHCAINTRTRQCAIKAGLPFSGTAVLRILNSKGQEIARLHDGVADAGILNVLWPAKANGKIAGGLYICDLIANGFRGESKFLLP
jgi:ligand-binding sensor domain-containing protein